MSDCPPDHNGEYACDYICTNPKCKSQEQYDFDVEAYEKAIKAVDRERRLKKGMKALKKLIDKHRDVFDRLKNR